MNLIDKEIEVLKDELIDEGKEEMTDSEIIFKKMGKVLDVTDDDVENPESKRYSVVSKELMERIANLRAEIDPKPLISSMSARISNTSSTSKTSVTAVSTRQLTR